MAAPVLPPIGDDVKAWGISLSTYLRRALPRFYHKTTDDNPSEDGIVLWDASKKYAVISLDGAFRQMATKQATPSANTGSAGDVAGMIAWDTNYIYICTGSHDGSTAIWKRVALSTW